MNKITVKIADTKYTFATDNDEQYAQHLAQKADERICAILSKSKYILPDQAIVLTLLDYAEAADRAAAENEKLKAQLKDYLADAAQAKSERDMLRRELAKFKKNPSGGAAQ